MKKLPFLLLALFCAQLGWAQDDLIKLLGEDKPRKEKVYAAFKSTRVVMSHSMELLRAGVLDFRILHRFGRLNGGVDEFFGLDGPATVRLGLDYGLTDFLTIGLGRSTLRKELDGFAKWRLLQQEKGTGAFPFSLVVIGGTTLHTLKWADTAQKHSLADRLAYYGQVIVGRKFSERLSLQVVPTVVHVNQPFLPGDGNNLFALGFGGRMKLTKRLSVNADYYILASGVHSANRHPPLSIGFDLETGGHVFQLHFTNAKGMNERAFLADTDYDWGRGDVVFGFNISRSFQLKKRRE